MRRVANRSLQLGGIQPRAERASKKSFHDAGGGRFARLRGRGDAKLPKIGRQNFAEMGPSGLENGPNFRTAKRSQFWGRPN